MPVETIYYVGPRERVEHHAAPLLRKFDVRIVDAKVAPGATRPGDLCVFFSEYSAELREACTVLREGGRATLYAIDGITEWRNIWEGGSAPEVMRPVLSHKAAVIGRSQARVLESWGNLGKCEVVGLPRLDDMLGRRPRLHPPDAALRVLVMTANTPGFAHSQRAAVIDSLRDLRSWFECNPVTAAGKRIFPVWRLTRGFEKAVGVPNALQDTTGGDLASALSEADALVTTPSTSMLEGMLQGIPVALLDYANSPSYTPAAWQMTSPLHIDGVMQDLLQPPEPRAKRMLFQDTVLHDALECRTAALPRLTQLVESMTQRARECLEVGDAISFPRRILEVDSSDHHLPEERFDLRRLFPDHRVHSDADRATLEAERNFLQRELHELRALHARETPKARLRAKMKQLRKALRLR